MSVYSTLRSLAFLSVITCGLVTAVWDGAGNLAPLHDRHRGDVIWINTDHL